MKISYAQLFVQFRAIYASRISGGCYYPCTWRQLMQATKPDDTEYKPYLN